MTKPNKRGRGGSYLLQSDGSRVLLQGTDQVPPKPEPQHKPAAEKAKPTKPTPGGE